MQEKKRLKEFDLLKTVAIFLVIWGHCIQDLYSSPPTENGVFTTIYSIHMPLFMTISGYFAWSSMQKGITTLLVKKVRQLLIPCISGSVMMWLSILLLAAFHNKSVSFYQLIHEIIYGYWFLKSCFLCYMLAWIGNQGGGVKS